MTSLPVEITAPKVRTSKNSRQSQSLTRRAWSPSDLPLALPFSFSAASGSFVASTAFACSRFRTAPWRMKILWLLPLRGRRKELHIVADLSLETDVGDEPALGEGVDAWLVAGVGVAIGVAVGDLEEDQDVVAVGDRLCRAH